MLERKWHWSDDNYDKVFRICLALIDMPNRWHPLRRDDLDRFHRMPSRTYEIRATHVERRRITLEQYRPNLRRRMDMCFAHRFIPIPRMIEVLD